MRIAMAVVWLAVGLYVIVSGLRFRGYINSLPASAENRRLRQQRVGFWVVGIIAIGAGLWQLFAFWAR